MSTALVSEPAGTSLARYAIILGIARGDLKDAQAMAAARPDARHLAKAFELASLEKAAVGVQHTEVFTGALTSAGLVQDALLLLRDLSVFDRLQSRMMRVPFLIPAPRQTSTGAAGSWRAEGRATPVSAFAFDTIRLEPHMASALTVVVNELLKMNNPGSEAAIRGAILNGIAAYVDFQFLSPSVTASDANPASITAGGTAVVSTGSTAAQMTTDFAAMLDAVTTSGRGLTWILQPQTAARIALVLGAAADFPRSFLGLPVVISGNSPQQVTLADLAEIAFADDGGFSLTLSEQAALQMDTAPTNAGVTIGSPSDPPTATSLVSLFQNNLTAFKASRWLSWEVLRTGAVAYMTTAY